MVSNYVHSETSQEVRMISRCPLPVALFAAACVLVAPAVADKVDFPELESFETALQDAMHGPVEEGNARALMAVFPDFRKTYLVLKDAPLPEAFSDVAPDYARAMKHMQLAMTDYSQAVENTDSAAVLAAMLAVHVTYARVEAALEGICYELVELHEAIAPIRHRALPNEDWAAIKAALPILTERVMALRTAEVPAMHADVKDDLHAEAEQMEKALAELETACTAGDPKAIEIAFGKVHDHYHSCMELFR
jgi:hypothetical protein